MVDDSHTTPARQAADNPRATIEALERLGQNAPYLLEATRGNEGPTIGKACQPQG